MTDDPGRPIKTLDLRAGQLWLRADGIVYHRNKPGVRHSLADVQAHYVAFIELCDGQRRPLIVDARGEFQADPGARQAYGKPPPENGPLALALVIDSGYGRTFGNLALAFSVQRLPTRMFNEEEPALVWVRKFLRAPR